MSELAPTTFQIPTLETERLFLRGFRPEDAEAEIDFYASARSASVGGPMPADQAWRLLATIVGHWALRGYGFFALEDKATGAYLGRVGLWYPHGWPEPEIGWTMMATGEGKGYAHEAALAARAWAYDSLGMTTLVSTIEAGNTRSEALARKLGAQRTEAVFKHSSGKLLTIWRHPGPHEGDPA